MELGRVSDRYLFNVANVEVNVKAEYDRHILGPKISKFVHQNSLFRSKIESKIFFFEKFQNIAQTVFDGGESDGGA